MIQMKLNKHIVSSLINRVEASSHPCALAQRQKYGPMSNMDKVVFSLLMIHPIIYFLQKASSKAFVTVGLFYPSCS